MNALVGFIASYVVSAAWQIPVLCLTGWCVARMLRSLGPAVQHRMWTTVLLLCVIVPALPAPRMHGSGVSIALAEVGLHRVSYAGTDPAQAWNLPIWAPVWLMQAAALAWMLTVLYSACRLLYAYRATQRLVAGATACEPSAELHAALRHCMHAFHLHEVAVMTHDRLAGPVTLVRSGRNVLLLPARMQADVSSGDLLAAVAHECAHMQRHDYATHLLLQVATLPVRFHPLTQRLQQQVVATREMACDAAAARLQGPVYRDALLRVAQWIASVPTTHRALTMGFAVGMLESNSLEDRMKRLLEPTKPTRRLQTVLLTTLAIGTMTGTAGALALHGMHLSPGTLSAMPSSVPSQPAGAAPFVQPQLIRQVDPDYPPAERAKEKGPATHTSVLGFTVNRNGVPQHVHVVQTGGQAFDRNAIKSVSQYRFKPAQKNGQNIASDLKISVNFQIF